MRIATWNVNSLRARTGRVYDFLQRHDIDVLAVQEIKCRPEQFDPTPFENLGYELELHGMNQWNGVGIFSRVGIDNIHRSCLHQPTFRDTHEPRVLGAQCADLYIWSVYVPHGRSLTDPHYAYKLQFLHALQDTCGHQLENNPNQALMVMGDFNIAPEDTDVWDMACFENSTHVSEPEREAFAAFSQVNMSELTRTYAPDYTYWDYRQLRFVKNEGMKIDFILGSPAVAHRTTHAWIDREERKGKGASDHAPVIVDIQDA